ncbi:hypothetical protein MSAN_01891900 [Mycena sanguinolenta]|uniref:Uncharacterized protein n=1 Tax=Mycena sanguinolenta TaxID=230812 RepID=A0A8H6XRI5_9AGAR|nr:hypothetical protein MSAN_01891900 [Mycena sanguinolenta]
MALCSDSEEIQSMATLEQVAHYTTILLKIDSCLRAQRNLGTIRRLFKQSELIAQLDNCETELKAALASLTRESRLL